MFVVRIICDDGRTDWKAFTRRDDAFARFDAAWTQTNNGDFLSTAVFNVAGEEDARKAIDAVQCKDSHHVELLEIKKPFAVELQVLNLNLDL